jgi:hypothetical protein
MSFTMAEIAGRRANQLGDFMRVLKFSAINLDAGARVAKERFGDGLDHASFTRTGGTQKNQVANRTVWRIQSRQEHLINLSNFFDRGILADDSAAKSFFKLSCVTASAGRIQNSVYTGFHIPHEPGSEPMPALIIVGWDQQV